MWECFMTVLNWVMRRMEWLIWDVSLWIIWKLSLYIMVRKVPFSNRRKILVLQVLFISSREHPFFGRIGLIMWKRLLRRVLSELSILLCFGNRNWVRMWVRHLVLNICIQPESINLLMRWMEDMILRQYAVMGMSMHCVLRVAYMAR